MDIIMVSASLGKARGAWNWRICFKQGLGYCEKSTTVVVFFFGWSEKGKRYTGWWQLKHFLFSPLKFGEDEPILTSICFKGVGKNHQLVHFFWITFRVLCWDDLLPNLRIQLFDHRFCLGAFCRMMGSEDQ